MKYKDFVKETICTLNELMFENAKKLLLDDYLSFSIIDPKDVTADILAEKVCDYFAALEAKTGKSFDKFIETYMNDIDSVVGHHIAKPVAPGKQADEVVITVPRSRKYYEKAIKIKSTKNKTVLQLIDFSRIMFCLYTAALKEEGLITNFNYSADCLIAKDIIEALEKEENTIVFPASKKKKFETKEPYCADTCTMILSIIILCSIISGKIEGDNRHE